MDKSKVHGCAAEGCRARLSSIDPHSKCIECRGMNCSFEDKCKECSDLSKEQYLDLEKRNKRNADKIKSKNREDKPSKPPSPVVIVTSVSGDHSSIVPQMELFDNFKSFFASALSDFRKEIDKSQCETLDKVKLMMEEVKGSVLPVKSANEAPVVSPPLIVCSSSLTPPSVSLSNTSVIVSTVPIVKIFDVNSSTNVHVNVLPQDSLGNPPDSLSLGVSPSVSLGLGIQSLSSGLEPVSSNFLCTPARLNPLVSGSNTFRLWPRVVGPCSEGWGQSGSVGVVGDMSSTSVSQVLPPLHQEVSTGPLGLGTSSLSNIYSQNIPASPIIVTYANNPVAFQDPNMIKSLPLPYPFSNPPFSLSSLPSSTVTSLSSASLGGVSAPPSHSLSSAVAGFSFSFPPFSSSVFSSSASTAVPTTVFSLSSSRAFGDFDTS